MRNNLKYLVPAIISNISIMFSACSPQRPAVRQEQSNLQSAGSTACVGDYDTASLIAANCRTVEGNVNLRFGSGVRKSLNFLESVQGDLVIAGTELEMDLLETRGGVPSVSIPVRMVTGRLEITGFNAVERIELAALESVDSLHLQQNMALEAVSAPQLKTARLLYFTGMNGMTSLSLPRDFPQLTPNAVESITLSGTALANIDLTGQEPQSATIGSKSLDDIKLSLSNVKYLSYNLNQGSFILRPLVLDLSRNPRNGIEIILENNDFREIKVLAKANQVAVLKVLLNKYLERLAVETPALGGLGIRQNPLLKPAEIDLRIGAADNLTISHNELIDDYEFLGSVGAVKNRLSIYDASDADKCSIKKSIDHLQPPAFELFKGISAAPENLSSC